MNLRPEEGATVFTGIQACHSRPYSLCIIIDHGYLNQYPVLSIRIAFQFFNFTDLQSMNGSYQSCICRIIDIRAMNRIPGRIETELDLRFPGTISKVLAYGSNISLAIEPLAYTGEFHCVAGFYVVASNEFCTTPDLGEPAA